MGKIEKAKGGGGNGDGDGDGGRCGMRKWQRRAGDGGGKRGKRKYGCHAKARAAERTEVRKAAEKKRDGGLR